MRLLPKVRGVLPASRPFDTKTQDAHALSGLGRAAAGTVGTGVGITAVNAISGVITARALGVNGRGILTICLLVPSLVAYLGDLGLPLALAYEAAQSRGSNNGSKLRAQGLQLAIMQSVALLIIGMPLVATYVHFRAHQIVTSALLFTLTYLPINLLTRYLLAIEQGSSQFYRFNLARLIVPASYTLLLVGLVLGRAVTVSTILSATVVSNCLGLLSLTRRATRLSLYGNLPYVQFRRYLSYGIRAHVGNLTPVDGMQLDLLLVAGVLGAHEAGLYSVGAAGAMFIRGQGTAVGLALFPKVAGAPSDDTGRALPRYFRWVFLGHAVMATVVVVISPLAIRALYGSEYGPAVSIMRILAVGAVFAGTRQVLGDALRGLGRPLRATINEVLLGLIGGPLVWLGITWKGGLGAAYGVTVAYVCATIIFMASFRESGLPFRRFLIGAR